MKFIKVPVDASSKMPDDYMDSIEPYHYNALEPFNLSYLAGFLADRYDMTVEETKARADERCIGSLESNIINSVTGFTRCHIHTKKINLKRGKVHYALLPVWLLHVKYRKEDYLFAINGQTGSVAGKLPLDRLRAAIHFMAYALPFGLIGSLIVMAIGG